MKKCLVLLSAVACVFCFTQAFAAPWAVVAVTYAHPDNSSLDASQIHTVDLGVIPPKAYGPFLSGKLGSYGGGLFDVVMVPGQRYALISNFGDSTIHRIDLLDPTNPLWLGKVQLDFFAEDIAVTADGKTALVTDGGFSSKVAFIDLKTFALSSTMLLGDKYANALAIGPDGTVLFADYFGGYIHYARLNGSGLTPLKSISLCGAELDAGVCKDNYFGRPVNVTISPNGKTALVANASGYLGAYLNVLEIRGPGDVAPGDPFFIKGLPGGNPTDYPTDNGTNGMQSIAFQSDAKAYALSQPRGYPDPDNASLWIDIPHKLSSILITGPGKAELGDNGTISMLVGGTSQLFGVDVLAIAGWQAVAGNPTVSGAFTGKMPYVNLHTRETTEFMLNNTGIPIGVALKMW